MKGLTWLHLSDWHQKGKEFDRKVVREALINDIKKRAEISPELASIDFIVFSGDLAHDGRSDEYNAAREELFKPLLEVTGLNPEDLFIVPGNHDLDRKKFELLPSALLEPLTKESDVQKWLTDEEKLSVILKPFHSFASFVSDYTHQEKPDYANIRRMEINGKTVALLGLNSAWMCGRNENAERKIGDKGFVLVGEPQILDPLNKISDADFKIAVIHHSLEWLADFDRKQVEGRLKRQCDFILHGHGHIPGVSETHGTSGDCVIIPAGPSYDERMAKNPYYTNSYNYVFLDFENEKGVAYFRRWSDRRNEWVEDVDSSRKGKYEFVFPRSSGQNKIGNSISPMEKNNSPAKKDRMADKDSEITKHSILVVGTAFGEYLLQLDGQIQSGQKHKIACYKGMGGSGVNYTLRLINAGVTTFPILPLGNDTCGNSIRSEILESARKARLSNQVLQFIDSAEFFFTNLKTPGSYILMDNLNRTSFSEQVLYQGFSEYTKKRIAYLENLQTHIDAIIIGHIFSDGPDVNPQNPGECTKYLIDTFQGNSLIFANFGNGQICLHADHWEKYLEKIDLFQLNLDEMRRFFSVNNERALLVDIIKWLNERSITSVITLDKFGAIGSYKDGSFGIIFAWPLEISAFEDSTGAGDAFISCLASNLYDKGDFNFSQFYEAIDEARYWAAYKCTTLGGASRCPDKDMLFDFKKELRREHNQPHMEVFQLNNATPILKILDKIVYE